jgi:Fe-S cluster biogenesis protein NfuA
MFIQTQATDNPDRMKFLPGCDVYPPGRLEFADADEAATESPLAARLFDIEEVTDIELGPDYVTVAKRGDADWLQLKPAVLGAIMDHFVARLPVVRENAVAGASGAEADAEGPGLDESDPVVAEIKELIETRIRPAATQGGGDVTLRGYADGVVYLELIGPAFQLKGGIENMLRHYVPEIRSVADWRDALPKPGLDTPEGRAIRELLETVINPQVAGHGGRISLVDVDSPRVYIRMEGGCQGCGMANMTLKQGVETQIRQVVPEIQEVLDVTDHAGGTNPYYQPA